MKRNPFLIAGGMASLSISVLHIAVIFGGASWYRFFGAGEEMGLLAEQGSLFPAMLTLGMVLMTAIWGLYAFSAAQLIRPLPFLKFVLGIIATVFILRGLVGVPAALYVDHPYLNELGQRMTFMVVSSLISLSVGILYLVGLKKL